jgi:hypothetical protein
VPFSSSPVSSSTTSLRNAWENGPRILALTL